MKMNILKIIVLSIIITSTWSLNSFAFSIKGRDGEVESEKIVFDVTQKINTNSWKPDEPGQNSEKFNKVVGKILGVIQNFGIIASVISLMIIGVRTMYGSLEEKSHYKEILPTFIIGVFILLSCTTIPNIIYKALGN